MIVSSATGELVPLGNQGLCKGACIGHNGPRNTQRLVRRRRDHVAMLEGRGMLLRGNEAQNVSDVRHEDSINLIRDGAEPRKIDGARVGRGTTENHGWAEEQRLFPQLLVFDDAHLGVLRPSRASTTNTNVHASLCRRKAARDEKRSAGSRGSLILTSPCCRPSFAPTMAPCVTDQTLGLGSDGTVELRMPECVRITDRHEHTAGEVLAQ